MVPVSVVRSSFSGRRRSMGHPRGLPPLPPDHAPATALAAAITEAELRCTATTADALLARPSAEPDRLGASLRTATASLHDALVLLGLLADARLEGPAPAHALQTTGRTLDTASLVLGDSAVRARGGRRTGAPGTELGLARSRLVHVLEQQEADIAARLREIQAFTLTVRQAHLEVLALAPMSDLPRQAQTLLTGLDLHRRIATLRTAVASSRRTVPNLATLALDETLPLSLDVHASAIAASAETARALDALLELRGAVAARWPETG